MPPLANICHNIQIYHQLNSSKHHCLGSYNAIGIKLRHSIIKSNSINQVQVMIAQVYLRRHCQTSATATVPTSLTYPNAIPQPKSIKNEIQNHLSSSHMSPSSNLPTTMSVSITK
eukprot:scaffold146396_cov73-Cyclotella_meneghiniana.AAC.6